MCRLSAPCSSRTYRIFKREAEADALLASYDAEVAALRELAPQAGRVLVMLTGGGRMSAHGPGSRFGMIHDDYGLTPAVTGMDTGNHGQAISPEFILEANPDWLFVIDRDSAIGRAGDGAGQLLDNALVHQTTAWQKSQIVYLDPAAWYIAPSGITAVTLGARQIRDAIAKRRSPDPNQPQRTSCPPRRPSLREPCVPRSVWTILLPGVILIGGLVGASLFFGVSGVTPQTLHDPATAAQAWQVLLTSRLPRTAALMLAGAGLAVAGLLLQMLVQNRFVEPSTVGTIESATLGMLLVMLLAPDLPVTGRMLVAAGFAMAGTGLFLAVLRAVPLRSTLMVPLTGILMSGVIGAVTTFVAWRTDMLQPLGAWVQGDFSVVLRGRYEILWIVGGLIVVAAVAADRFTVAKMGRDFAIGLGLRHGQVMALGLTLVSVVSAAVLVTVGTIPFLGLIVPNIAALWVGDNMRRALPVSVLGGMGLVLACDIFGRWVIHPYELPIGATMGVIGSIVFLFLLLQRTTRVG